jgi:bacterioferritin (cytochrome b1)
MSLVSDLNELLTKTRGALEGAQVIKERTHSLDQDIERGIDTVIENEHWATTGLYHRITQLDGTPTIQTSDFPSDIANKNSLRAQLGLLRSYEQMIVHSTRELMHNDEFDDTTRDFLIELRNSHHDNAEWCDQTLEQWRA